MSGDGGGAAPRASSTSPSSSGDLGRDLALFQLYRLLSTSYLFAPVIVLFFAGRGLSFTEITLLNTVYAVTAALFEVPTGALADRWGRRRAMVLGSLLMAAGCVVNFAGHGFAAFAVGEGLLALGEAGLLHHIVGHSEPGIPLQICPMCGPTIVVRRDQHSGDHVYCRTCGAETMLTRTGEGVSVAPTGRLGSAEDLKPDVDRGLVAEMVAALAPFWMACSITQSTMAGL